MATMIHVAHILLLILSFVSVQVHAQADVPVLLNDEQLHLAYSGQTHVSYYRQNIETYGGVFFEESYHADGTLDYRAGEVTSAGFWQVANGKICFQYPGTPLADGCFVVVKEGGCFYSYEIGIDGRPIGLASGEWWIRATIEGSDGQCSTADLVS